MRLTALFLAALALISCGPALPKLPDIDFTRFPPAVRESIEKAYSAAELAPRDAINAAAVGKVLHAHGLLDQAIVFYQHARQLDPQSVSYVHLLGAAQTERGKFADAIDTLNAALAMKGDSRPTQFLLAEAMLGAGTTVPAGELFASLGAHPVAHYGRARTLQGQAALNEYQKALALAPYYGAAWKGLADLYRAMGQAEKADEAERAFARHRNEQPRVDDPELKAVRELDVSTNGLLSRAAQAAQEARLADAARLYEQAVQADPENDTTAAALMGVQVQLRDFEAAEKTYQNAQRRKRESGGLAYRYGQVLAGTKRIPEAKAMLEKALELDPQQAGAWFELGKLHEAAGARDQAFDCYGKGLYLDPANYKERFYGARILAAQGRPDAALILIRQALNSPPDDETVAMRLALAAVHDKLKQPERAIDELRLARQLALARNLPGQVPAIDRELARLGAKP